MKYIFALVLGLGHIGLTGALAQSNYTLSGHIRDRDTGEELIGATVYIQELKTGTSSNAYGFYSVSIAEGTYELVISYIGYTPMSYTLDLKEDQTLDFQLSTGVYETKEVVIRDKAPDENVQDISMSKNIIEVERLKKMPALFGESDIIKAIQMQPGVISAGEGTSSYFVRGGSADQNLILIDEAPIYDPSHLFGLFSVFNSDAIKNSELYKGGIPAQYGGRLSSVLDVRTKDGNNQRIGASGGIGILASRLMIEGPIKKENSSFLLSGRRSYVDLFQRLSNDKDISENLVSFYDLNAKVNFKTGDKDRLYAAGYFGRDNFSFGDDASFSWGNATATLRWNHLYSNKLFSNTSVIASRFNYGLEITSAVDGFKWTANLEEVSLKQDFGFYLNPANEMNFGYQGSFKYFSPGLIEPTGSESIYKRTELQQMRAFEHAIYVSNKQEISTRLLIDYGIRLSIFQHVGKGTIYEYSDPTDNVNRERIGEKTYDNLEVIKTFINPEPRISARYILTSTSSLKVSYNRMVQYVHLISNSTIPVPFNTWAPSSPYADPQKADQIAAGYFRNFKDNMYAFSAEAYYKKMYDVLDFADNPELFFNEDIATEFRPGNSDSYGLELFAQKIKGSLVGSASYTWSKTTREIPGVNQGVAFPANYDRRHNLYLAAAYDLNEKWVLGANFVYSTGRPLTLPTGQYEYDGYPIDLYSGRNEYQLPDFHRLDLSATVDLDKNKTDRWASSLTISIYNVYSRKNAFTIYSRIRQDDDGNIIGNGKERELRMVYLFPVMPTVTYNFKF